MSTCTQEFVDDKSLNSLQEKVRQTIRKAEESIDRAHQVLQNNHAKYLDDQATVAVAGVLRDRAMPEKIILAMEQHRHALDRSFHDKISRDVQSAKSSNGLGTKHRQRGMSV